MRPALLVKSEWWNTFLINIISVILIWTVSFIMTVPLMITGFSAGILNQSENPIEYPDWYWIVIGFSTEVSSVFWVIPSTFLAFQYFNLEERTKK